MTAAGDAPVSDAGRQATPWRDPALAVELTERERRELMTVDDWSFLVDRELTRMEADDA